MTLKHAPEIHNSSWLLAELMTAPEWHAEQPSAAKIGEVTAALALDELHADHSTHTETDDMVVSTELPALFIGNATNVGMVARAVAAQLGRGDNHIAAVVAEQIFEEGRIPT